MISSKKETLNFGMTCFKGTETKKGREKEMFSHKYLVYNQLLCVFV